MDSAATILGSSVVSAIFVLSVREFIASRRFRRRHQRWQLANLSNANAPSLPRRRLALVAGPVRITK